MRTLPVVVSVVWFVSLARADHALPGSSAPEAVHASDPYRFRPSVMAGLSQWTIFGGANVAAQVKTGRLVFEYSHGQALDFSRLGGFTMTSEERDAGASVRMPWTTGGGFGLQITPNLHLLLEVKAHRYEVRGIDANERVEYTTFTVGPGVFYDIYLWRGLFVQPNLRWWPTVASTYGGGAKLESADGGTYEHHRHDLVPFVNVNVGWTFDQP